MQKVKLLIITMLLVPNSAFAGNVSVVVPAQLHIDIPGIRHYFKNLETVPIHEDIEIKIYYFSSGVEVLTLQNDMLVQSEKMGQAKALVKLKENGILKKALFVEVAGANKKALLINLARKIAEALGRVRS